MKTKVLNNYNNHAPVLLHFCVEIWQNLRDLLKCYTIRNCYLVSISIWLFIQIGLAKLLVWKLYNKLHLNYLLCSYENTEQNDIYVFKSQEFFLSHNKIQTHSFCLFAYCASLFLIFPEHSCLCHSPQYSLLPVHLITAPVVKQWI